MFGMVVGPFGLVTSLAGIATATVVDAVGTTDAIWAIASVLLLVLAADLLTLRSERGERTDVRGLLRKARDAGLGPGLFDGSVDLEDVLGVGALGREPVDDAPHDGLDRTPEEVVGARDDFDRHPRFR
jgi:hypothetical protein